MLMIIVIKIKLHRNFTTDGHVFDHYPVKMFVK